jgi:hypothetical protein
VEETLVQASVVQYKSTVVRYSRVLVVGIRNGSIYTSRIQVKFTSHGRYIRRMSHRHTHPLTLIFKLSPTSMMDSVDARISELERLARDNVEPGIQSELAVLKKDRNALAPFCAAPDEIIARILVGLAWCPRDISSLSELTTFSCSIEWTTVMLVCSRMRLVVLQTPELWSFIDGFADVS